MDVDLMDLEDLEVLEMLRRPNNYRIRVNPFDLSDEDFRYKYRFTKDFGKKIVELIRDDLSHDPRGCSISPEMQVLCALRNWGRHEIQDDTADLHGISQPAVSNICKKVAGALARISHRFIKMPATLDKQEENMRKFRSIANFATVISAIDCTHIRVKKIRTDGGQLYINRKGFPSINVQVVCDADLKIMACDYACTHYLFTPLLNPSTPQEERYNRAHKHTRNTIERCFGLWKQRFRCLLRGMYGNIETCKKTIVACAVLHNIAIDMKEGNFPEGSLYDQPASSRETGMQRSVMNTIHGNIRRRQFIETNF